MNHWMFSYGMNTNLTQMFLRCRAPKLFKKTRLWGYEFNFRHHADIQEVDNDLAYVDGIVWQLDDDDLESIDRLEGYPTYYTRFMIAPRGSNKLLPGLWTYEMVHKTQLQFPSQSYLDCLIEGYKQNDLPLEQIYDALDRCEDEMRYHGEYNV